MSHFTDQCDRGPYCYDDANVVSNYKTRKRTYAEYPRNKLKEIKN